MNKRDKVHWQRGMFYNKKIKIWPELEDISPTANSTIKAERWRSFDWSVYNSKDEKLDVYDSSNLFNIQVLQSRN